MWRILFPLGVCCALVLGTSALQAEVFEFDVPELQGDYFPGSGTVTVPLDLSVSFAEISSVSLRLTGTHTVGQIQWEWPDGEFLALPLDVLGGYRATDPYLRMRFEQRLPGASGGPFDETLLLRGLSNMTYYRDYRELMDGRVDFYLLGSFGPMIPEVYIVSYPSMTVQSATLVVEGSIVPEPCAVVLGISAATGLLGLARHRLRFSAPLAV
jgi:hypothetical protein